MKYLVLGAGGMAGHMITNYLLEQGEDVEGLERRNLNYCKTHILDVTNFDDLKNIILENNYDIIINCIGILNQSAENQKDMAVLINSYLPHFLVEITKEMKTRIIHMSTDCVFSGKKGNYKENDLPDGTSFYDKSKALGEINDEKNLTFRNSIIGPDINRNGIGLFNWFMKQYKEIDGYSQSLWTGVTTLTLAKAMHKASYDGLNGLYNLVNNQKISKYNLIKLFNKYSYKNLKINKVNGIIQDKSLCCTRNDFDFVVPDYETQIMEMFEWINEHKDFYNYSSNSVDKSVWGAEKSF